MHRLLLILLRAKVNLFPALDSIQEKGELYSLDKESFATLMGCLMRNLHLKIQIFFLKSSQPKE